MLRRHRLTAKYALIVVMVFLVLMQLLQYVVIHGKSRKCIDFGLERVQLSDKDVDIDRNMLDETSINVKMDDVYYGDKTRINDQRSELWNDIKPIDRQVMQDGVDLIDSIPQKHAIPLENNVDIYGTPLKDGTNPQHEIDERIDAISEQDGIETHNTQIFDENQQSGATIRKDMDLVSDYRKSVAFKYYQPKRNEILVNCSAIVFDDSEQEVKKAKHIMKKRSAVRLPMMKYIRTLNCERYIQSRGYIMHPFSDIERDFPLAFSMIVYRDFEQVERLLRAIYRPQNYYCVHIDQKTDTFERKAFEVITKCFDNVMLTEISYNVTWGTFSVLQAELQCMEMLWKFKHWRYFINLTGQEFPLKTNKELVEILKSFQGANIVDGTWIRARAKYFYRWTKAKVPPPHRIRLIKGSVHIAVNRDFVQFSLFDPIAIDFRKWLENTDIPDETFFSSLNHNPHLGINGSFLGEAEEYPLKPSLIRYKNWELDHSTFTRNCEGKFVRNICVLGIGDIHRAYTDIGLFVNKFHLDFEYLALDCLESVLYEKTWRQYLYDEPVDTSYYSHLDYVKKKLMV